MSVITRGYGGSGSIITLGYGGWLTRAKHEIFRAYSRIVKVLNMESWVK